VIKPPDDESVESPLIARANSTVKRVTIVDVAQAAGVSLKTVSRVLNGGKNVRPQVRERVESVMRELSYHPSLAARQLSGQKSYILTLIGPRAGTSYFARMMVAVATEAQARGYQLITELLEAGWTQDSVMRGTSVSARADAYIVAPPLQDNASLLAQLEEEGVPTVRIAGTREGYGTSISIDDTTAAKEMVEHLLALGHRRIGMIAPPLPPKAAESRVDGYRLALERAGVEFDPDLIVRGRALDFATGATCATELLALTHRPTAIFAANDDMALGALAQAQRLGYAIPDDLAVAGFDDSPMSRMVFPTLTTIRQRIREIARAAVHAALEGEIPADADLSARLIIRGSTSGNRDLCLEPFEF
jgi:LacI family transcriptional regulator